MKQTLKDLLQKFEYFLNTSIFNFACFFFGPPCSCEKFRPYLHFRATLGTPKNILREGAKFIGLHQGQPGWGGAKSFWEEKMTGQTLFRQKMTALGHFYRKRMTGRRRFIE